MLGFQGGVSIPLVKGGVKAPPAKRQCRAGPKAGARRGFTARRQARLEAVACTPMLDAERGRDIGDPHHPSWLAFGGDDFQIVAWHHHCGVSRLVT